MRVAAVFLVVALATPAVAAGNPSEQIIRAHSQFDRGEYEQVVTTLEPQLYPVPQIVDVEERKKGYYFLAVSHFYLDHKVEAERFFQLLLLEDPKYELDSLTESTDVYAFFTQLKQRMKDQLAELEKVRELDRQKREKERQIIITRTVHQQAGWVNFVPLGVPQFKYGSRGWGLVFLASQALFGVTSLGAFTLVVSEWGFPANVPPAEADRYNRLTVIQIGTGALFLASYIAGIFHGYAIMPPPVVETREDRPFKPTESTQLFPLIGPDFAGAGLKWEF